MQKGINKVKGSYVEPLLKEIEVIRRKLKETCISSRLHNSTNET